MSGMPEVPEASELLRIADEYGFQISPEELGVYAASIDESLQAYAQIERLHGEIAATPSPMREGARPADADNPHGGWAWKMSLQGATSGPLAGKRIVIKDNVAVAGAPMLNGSALLEGFVPQEDATVVSRILSAGGMVAGKAVCENLCFSGGSHTSYPRYVENPRAPGYMTGGSSSGCAALIASGECDMAIGGDQGGSVRIPASWCGIIGLKPTWGLIPYTGAFPIEPSLDHLGPMGTRVEDIACLLDVVAGRDGLDSRQIDVPFERPSYSAGLNEPGRKLRIGILQEGFGWEGVSNPQVDALVRQTAEKWRGAGCEVYDVSVPLHRHGLDIWTGIATEGAWGTMVRDNSVSHGPAGFQDVGLIAHYARARRERASDFSATVKSVILLGAYLHETDGGIHYGRAQNLRRTLRAAYDAVLRDVDVLVMPTTPQLPTPLEADGSLDTYLGTALNMMNNTATFDVSGHPALSMPCGTLDGLPVGMMLVGRRFDEATLLAAAWRFEQSGYAQ